MTSKRLLIVTDFPHIGGAERVVLQTVSHIDRSRFSPIVIAPREEKFSRELRRRHAEVELLDLEKLKRDCRLVFPVLLTLSRLIKIIKRERIDIIHANSLWTLKFSTIASIMSGRPLVAMIHAYPKIHSRLKRFVHILTRRFCYARASSVVAVSQALRVALIEDKAPSEKTIVIPNGLSPEWFAEPVSSPKGEAKTILTVGRLHPGKGQQVFLKAAAIVKESLPNTRFVVAGNEYKTSLEELGFRHTLDSLVQELGISDSVEFTGYVSDLRALYDRTSIVVLASFEETFGLVALEAMARGRLVIASRIPGVTELVKDGQTGLLFEPGDHEDLARQICRALSDEELATRLSGAATDSVRGEYILTNTLKRLEEAYAGALGQD
ncbi:glycosyltransferase family 4 protein [bacterium]|nr:glycosyltransferase family 4 protein [bacterium]